MKLKFTVSTNINSQETFGAVDTPMLLLGKLTGHGLGSHFQALDLNVGGVISEEIEKKGFSGERGKHFVIPLDQEDAPEKIMVVGLGSPDKFDTKALSQVIGMAVANAIKQDCRKLSVPILPNRQTQWINLRGQAHIIKRAAQLKLATAPYDQLPGEFEIELVCTPQAKTHLEKGLKCQNIAPNGVCCD